MVDEEHKKIVGNLLPELESKEINQLLEYSEFRNKPPGNILINQGTKDQNLYLVLSGDLAIFQKYDLIMDRLFLELEPSQGPRW